MLEIIKDLGMMFATESSKRKVKYSIFKCGFCGHEFRAVIQAVNRCNTKSCGCHKRRRTIETHTIHGLVETRIYNIWRNMKGRVTNHTNRDYTNYGGRGITLCEEWLDVIKFYTWAMENGYSDELSIDRIDNDKGYAPENCRWTTSTIQNRNKRMQKDNTSGFKGAYFNKNLNKYQASISILNKAIHLGVYLTAIEAGIAYNNYIIENNLEGFILNEIPDGYKND